ncbi:MAG TPA: AGE family epimerase/isomerase, partial [Nakamurella sp.]
PAGGAGWLDDTGAVDLSRPVHTYITARMAHVYCLADLLGDGGGAALADQALAGLTEPLRDSEHGGWLTQIAGTAGVPDIKACYDHAFVVLAAASGTVTGRPGARDLLAAALDVLHERFWDATEAMYVDHWDRSFSKLSPYRGINANMHAVEALLAATDATGDTRWRRTALGIAQRVTEFARHQQWRIPEHYDPAWRPLFDHNRDRPDDPFQPFGATVGHGMEWSRLMLHLHAGLGVDAPDWLTEAAVELFDRAVTDGWAVDGAPGFVYTTDWSGQPVVRQRMCWVLAEAAAAAAALHQRTGHDHYLDQAADWWDYARRYLIDLEHGSWHHDWTRRTGQQPPCGPGNPTCTTRCRPP